MRFTIGLMLMILAFGGAAEARVIRVQAGAKGANNGSSRTDVAGYDVVTYTLTVNSSGASGVAIESATGQDGTTN